MSFSKNYNIYNIIFSTFVETQTIIAS
jgi:hypothetical protein